MRGPPFHIGGRVYILRKSPWGSTAVTGPEDSNDKHKEYSSRFTVNSNGEAAVLIAGLSQVISPRDPLGTGFLRVICVTATQIAQLQVICVTLFHWVCLETILMVKLALYKETGLRMTKNPTHPKKSAWSDEPYREGERISSGYSVSLVLSVPRPIAAITKRTGRMT